MGERECLPDAYCSSCAADIMAKARNPLYSADGRNSPDGATTQHHLFREPRQLSPAFPIVSPIP